ncbi:nicotinate phosphoribosyltransferase [Candidatus Mycoplasma mahonii]|nr:nicotinate phosphoribosyltransferase [Candidatus Mycoplasma mahonii]
MSIILKYSAKYFSKTAKISQHMKPSPIVTMQFFQRQPEGMLAGMDEVLELLKKHTDLSQYTVKYLPEGSVIHGTEVVLEFEGHYHEFGEYEGMIDGILSRSTSLASNARDVVKAAKGKDVIFMGDRSDHYTNQERDGYAIALGGILTQVTDAHIALHDGSAIGTIPHAMIQMHHGDIVKTLKSYRSNFPHEKLVALVDFNNDVISDSIKCFKTFGDELVAVRIDTSEGISDAMFLNDEEFGVTPNLIKSLRNALNHVEANKVKIIVSSGFNVEKINMFEETHTPVDVYGVGASLLKIKHTFSADSVKLNGKELAKVGRKYQINTRLKLLTR